MLAGQGAPAATARLQPVITEVSTPEGKFEELSVLSWKCEIIYKSKRKRKKSRRGFETSEQSQGRELRILGWWHDPALWRRFWAGISWRGDQ